MVISAITGIRRLSEGLPLRMVRPSDSPKGDIHYQFAGRWEGEWQAWRMHMECQESGWAEGDISEGFTPFENERPAKLVVH